MNSISGISTLIAGHHNGSARQFLTNVSSIYFERQSLSGMRRDGAQWNLTSWLCASRQKIKLIIDLACPGRYVYRVKTCFLINNILIHSLSFYNPFIHRLLLRITWITMIRIGNMRRANAKKICRLNQRIRLRRATGGISLLLAWINMINIQRSICKNLTSKIRSLIRVLTFVMWTITSWNTNGEEKVHQLRTNATMNEEKMNA